MLVLNRYINTESNEKETIVCELPNGERITFIVLGKFKNIIRIGIDAPKSVSISRSKIDDVKLTDEGVTK